MKKIFAIALALVMVLSMTVAFAAPIKKNCAVLDFTYNCKTEQNYCGKATIDVVPYVKVNNGCGSYDWQASECASAVSSEKVYYAVKLEVEAYADPAWFAKAVATLSYKGLVSTTAPTLGSDFAAIPGYLVAKDVEDQANTFYLNFNTGKFDLVEDGFTFGGAHVKEEFVDDASKAKVCVKMTSEDDGMAAVGYEVGDFTFFPGTNYLSVHKNFGKATAKGISFTDSDGDGLIDTVANTDTSKPVDTEFYAEVTSKFNLNCGYGTCINADNWKAIFGWKDKVEECFSWSDKAASIVDAECVVAIPKTGDASVLAWLF